MSYPSFWKIQNRIEPLRQFPDQFIQDSKPGEHRCDWQPYQDTVQRDAFNFIWDSWMVWLDIIHLDPRISASHGSSDFFDAETRPDTLSHDGLRSAGRFECAQPRSRIGRLPEISTMGNRIQGMRRDAPIYNTHDQNGLEISMTVGSGCPMMSGIFQ